ncbi:hypothetical protein [Cytobacillus luteolus]|nr:hypothetical protein [Cytobacillus luteolus]MBP1943250.1 hypothetical protein [Cytobacillus luteolus]
MAETSKVKRKSRSKKAVVVSEKHQNKSEQWQRFYQLVEQRLKK